MLNAIRSSVGAVGETVSGLPLAGSEATDGAGPAGTAENASGR